MTLRDAIVAMSLLSAHADRYPSVVVESTPRKVRSRSNMPSDDKAFKKRVAKRRAKKGYS